MAPKSSAKRKPTDKNKNVKTRYIYHNGRKRSKFRLCPMCLVDTLGLNPIVNRLFGEYHHTHIKHNQKMPWDRLLFSKLLKGYLGACGYDTHSCEAFRSVCRYFTHLCVYVLTSIYLSVGVCVFFLSVCVCVFFLSVWGCVFFLSVGGCVFFLRVGVCFFLSLSGVCGLSVAV
eukprot:GHVR01051847.1.p2 GENE.GHVR01051847.1~~GHVR01051847.1.p2  ORF type:complete len:173 (+),score=27.05 GHVR01051847.1:69-587(+)